MGHTRKDYRKKWLISRLKTSGSKRRYVIDGDYCDTRHISKKSDWHDLPSYEGMGNSLKFYNNKINFGLLVRFLKGKVGHQWSEVHKEVIQRIPNNLLEYEDCLKWFVADLVEKREDGLWDKRSQKYLWQSEREPVDFDTHSFKKFYVDPKENTLELTISL